jgi:hypothetical protein
MSVKFKALNKSQYEGATGGREFIQLNTDYNSCVLYRLLNTYRNGMFALTQTLKLWHVKLPHSKYLTRASTYSSYLCAGHAEQPNLTHITITEQKGE